MNTINLQSSSVLVSLNLSAPTGRRKEKNLAESIDSQANTQTKVTAVSIDLFAGDEALRAVHTHDSATRELHKKYTLPWSHKGINLLPMQHYMEYVQLMGDREREREALVSTFLQEYSTTIAKQAFTLGALFDRSRYPTGEQIQDTFGFEVQYMPLPTAGDFRVDINNEGLAKLREQYEKQTQAAIDAAMQSIRERFKVILERMVSQLRDKADTDKKRPPIHDSLLESARELIQLLPSLNITNDSQLNHTRDMLLAAIDGLETDDLKDDDMTRRQVRDTAQELLEKWDW